MDVGKNRAIKAVAAWWGRLHYGGKVLISYLGLCFVAVIACIVLYWWLDLSSPSDKGSIVAVVVGLLAWTAAMIVPIAAFYAIADWREQQRALSKATIAKKIIDLSHDLKNQNSAISRHKLDHVDFIMFGESSEFLEPIIDEKLWEQIDLFIDVLTKFTTSVKENLLFLQPSKDLDNSASQLVYDLNLATTDLKKYRWNYCIPVVYEKVDVFTSNILKAYEENSKFEKEVFEYLTFK